MISRQGNYKTYLPFAAACAALTLALTPSCALVPAGEDEDESPGSASQPEVWTNDDDPDAFGAELERKLSSLPSSGETDTTPWPGAYWPTWRDSINDRWDGSRSLSPAEKYGKAFGISGVEDAVSRQHGIDSRTEAARCSRNADCDTDKGEVCAKRRGQTRGRCIPKWFGLCHAWAAASILMPEPQHDVVMNGVTFKVQDIKALITLVHNSPEAIFVSKRCEADESSGEISTDENGRPQSACRDTNPGTFHLLLTNYVGVRHEPFLEDRTYDLQVWNHPIREFKVVSQSSVTAKQANQRIGVAPEGGQSLRDSGSLAKGEWSGSLVLNVSPGQSYVARIEGTGDADLYVRYGSAPTESQYLCRPFYRGSSEECHGVVPPNTRKIYLAVRGGDLPSTYSLTAMAGQPPSDYEFNSNAASFAYMKTDVSYVMAAPGTADGVLSPDIDQYTKVERYEYILELDENGDIIGGEWVGDAKHRHPDFLWLPSGPDNARVAGGKITYDRVKDLADRSVEAEGSARP